MKAKKLLVFAMMLIVPILLCATVAGAVTITDQPDDVVVAPNDPAEFSVTATGTGTLHFQWIQDGVEIPGATDEAAGTSTYTIPNVTEGYNGATFWCAITDDNGTKYSDSATLTVYMAPMIVTQPEDQTILIGWRATFSVAATGTEPLIYQWFKVHLADGDAACPPSVTCGTAIPWATDPSYQTLPLTMDDNACYRCEVTNNIPDPTKTSSEWAQLTVTPRAPTFVIHPIDRTVDVGKSAVFRVWVLATDPVYVWLRDGSPISGAPNSPAYSTGPVTIADHGAKFSCRVYNQGYEDIDVYSNTATLTVSGVEGPTITKHPSDVTVTVDETATFTVEATGTGTLTYQWKVSEDGGGTYSDVKNDGEAWIYTTDTVVTTDNGNKYRCVVTGLGGAIATSNAATLTVEPHVPPSITKHPTSKTVYQGQTATFTVEAAGTGTLTYQWEFYKGIGPFDDVDEGTGATTPTYTTPPATEDHDGVKYRCVVSNGGGESVTSNHATLTVLTPEPPVIDTQPESQTKTEGETATFTVVASDSSPLTYRWERNAVPVGTNSPSYTTPPVSMADNGARYRCLVSNVEGSVYSDEATLTVEPGAGPMITQDPTDQAVSLGEQATFTVVATGPALEYHWLRDDIYITGAENASYTTDPVTAADEGAMFSCEVSNSGGTVTSNKAVLTVITEPTATFPFEEGFESGGLADYWTASSTGTGRIQVTALNGPCSGTYQLTMDSSQYWSFGLNELVLNINLAGQSGVMLRFDHKEFNDDNHTMPSSFTGSDNSDGVAISEDGNTWHKVQGLTSADGTSSAWQCYDVDLDAAVQAAGISFNGAFKIKFQQYGRDPIVSTTFPFSDGFAFDNIEVYQ